MRPVTSEESDQYLAVLLFPQRVPVTPAHTHRFLTTCVYMYVCAPVAVYRAHVELQVRIHTLVYICTYKHAEGISTISPKYCMYLHQECK